MGAPEETVTEWLSAQLLADECTARAAAIQLNNALGPDRPRNTTWQGYAVEAAVDHIERWDPASILADIEAKRTILYLCGEQGDQHAADVACILAFAYRARPGYRPEWAPVVIQAVGAHRPSLGG